MAALHHPTQKLIHSNIQALLWHPGQLIQSRMPGPKRNRSKKSKQTINSIHHFSHIQDSRQWHRSGLPIITKNIQKKFDQKWPSTELLQLTELYLNDNDFLFNHQLTKCFLQPTLYPRNLDDIWPYSNSQFSEFINILNSHHYWIKVRYTKDPDQFHVLSQFNSRPPTIHTQNTTDTLQTDGHTCFTPQNQLSAQTHIQRNNQIPVTHFCSGLFWCMLFCSWCWRPWNPAGDAHLQPVAIQQVTGVWVLSGRHAAFWNYPYCGVYSV